MLFCAVGIFDHVFVLGRKTVVPHHKHQIVLHTAYAAHLAFVLLVVVLSFLLCRSSANTRAFSDQRHCLSALWRDIDYTSFLFFAVFLSNVALVFAKPVAGAAQTWSVSVEEQFYVVWPWLVKITRNSRQLFILIALAFAGKSALNYLVPYAMGNGFWGSRVLDYFPIEFMCIGALGAIAFFGKRLQKGDAFSQRPLYQVGCRAVAFG